jgi:hypothetical protein
MHPTLHSRFRFSKDLEKYIPVGKYSKTELSNKMSLYLLAQLFYGIVIVHNLQASAFLDSLQQLAKSLLRIPQPERAKRSVHSPSLLPPS